mmetsp:Transcript_19995/g.39279  ORF Transcript_19995/g.39279 Transcript_19995/m.39279 type:complete len:848 (+) Transcript_19995:374-2917(+)
MSENLRTPTRLRPPTNRSSAWSSPTVKSEKGQLGTSGSAGPDKFSALETGSSSTLTSLASVSTKSHQKVAHHEHHDHHELEHESIKVCVRFRPVNTRERKASGASNELAAAGIEAPDVAPWSWNKHSVLALFPITRGERSRQRTRERYGDAAGVSHNSTTGADGSGQFIFDRVFGIEESNATLYEEIMQDLVKSSMEGKHCAAFAFGPTSTGKTFSMQGTAEHPGVIPRAVHDVFAYVSEHQTREFLLRASYMEVYNESINDLFEPASTNLKVFEDPRRGPQVQGLEEKIVVSPDQVFALISAGEAQRKVGCTDYNKQSSRSHTIFRLVIESKAKTNADSETARSARVATLNLVDLAGSESAQNVQNKVRRQEGSHINKSLLTLTNIIYKLSDGAAQKGQHIPYRDSKLTRILQASLQGNSRVSIVCTCTPWEGAREETLSTLRFATRAKKVSRTVQVNEVLDERALLLQYKREIAELRRKLADAERRTINDNDADSASESEPPTPTPPSPSTPVTPGRVFADFSLTPVSNAPKSSKSREEKIRAQIDAAIANLNRVILNSSTMGPLSGGMRSRSGSLENDGDSVLLDNPPGLLSEDGADGDELESHQRGQTPFFRRISSLDRVIGEDVNRTRMLRSRSEGSAQEEVAAVDSARENLEARMRSLSDRVSVSSKGDTEGEEPLPSPPRSSSRLKKRHSITAELRSIREQLANLLTGSGDLDEDHNIAHNNQQQLQSEDNEHTRKAGSTTGVVSLDDIPEQTKAYVQQLEARVNELEGQVRKYALEQSVTRADRSFLESMLREKDATIAEWSNEIQVIEQRQKELEEENFLLQERICTLEAQASANGKQ